MKINSFFENFIVFNEGKKQAKQILISIPNIDQDDILNQIVELDPSSNNKYVELFAKFYKAKTPLSEIKKILPELKEAESKKKVKDISSFKTFDSFKNHIQSGAKSITKSSKSKGIAGLKKGEHYFDFGIVESKLGNYQGYVPLSYEASKIIASKKVGGVEGKWCISYQKDSSYWVDYAGNEEQVFVMLISEDKSLGDDQKLCVQFDKTGEIINVWDAADVSNSAHSYFEMEE